MSELSDSQVARLLDRLVPATAESSEWERIVAAASASPRPRLPWFRRKRLLAVALAALVLLVVAPLSALAVTQGWWFFRFGMAPKPIGGVTVVAQGTWDHVPWTLTAYRSSTDGICFALTPGAQTRASGFGGAMDCDTITGVRMTPQSKRSTPHAISYLMGGRPRLPDYITGPVVDTAKTVEIRFIGGTSIRVATIPAPSGLQSRIRFYVTQLPARRASVREVVGIDDHGRVVAHLVVPIFSHDSAAYRMSNRGKRVRLSPAFQHVLRVNHRSTDVWLLASFDGHNYYRMGGRDISRGIAHVCFGVGKAIDVAKLPATRRAIGQLAGLVMCSPRTATTFPSPEQPVWDLSIYGANRGDKEVTLFRLAGVASDAVKAVNLLDDHRRVVERVPVIDNVYSLEQVPKGVVLVVPVDAGGQALAECGPGAKARVRGTGTYLRARC